MHPKLSTKHNIPSFETTTPWACKPQKYIRQLARLFHTHDGVNANPERISSIGGEDGGSKSPEDAPSCLFCSGTDFLDNDGTDTFGVVSWRCACKPVPKFHLRCVLSYFAEKDARRTPCPVCKGDISFGKSSISTPRSVRLNIHNPPENDAGVPLHEDNDPTPDGDDKGDSDYEEG